MKTPTILNVHVSNLSEVSTKCALGWSTPDGMRFHYWTTLESKRPETSRINPHGILYKNCSEKLKSGDPGHFWARELDPTAKANAAMIAEAMRIADEKMLWTGAVAELNAKIEQRDREHVAAVILRRKHDAGPQLYDALLKALEAMKRARPNFQTEVDKLLAEAERIGLDAIHAANTDNEANRNG